MSDVQFKALMDTIGLIAILGLTALTYWFLFRDKD